MDPTTVLAPRRTLVVPTLVVLAPLLWFGYRGAGAPPHVTGAFEPTSGAVLAVAVAVGVSLSVVWVFLLAGGTMAMLDAISRTCSRS